ncbi:hypothetical protein [Streptomyces sp. NPDC001594]|uniref:hypothetical protein n=1 Tax=Streptomyces sp. NPDC001594 TaxID=3364590 RepID=UPI0036B86EC5
MPIAVGLELVRSMLRDNGAWCRLEAGRAFALHVGWDQYLYIGSNLPCETALARTRALGLFPERMDASPYDFAPDDPAYVQRPADADSGPACTGRSVATGRCSWRKPSSATPPGGTA